MQLINIPVYTRHHTSKMYSRNAKTANEPTANNNNSRQITGEHLGHMKDLDISKYKRFFSLERP